MLFKSSDHYCAWDYAVADKSYYWPWSNRKRIVRLSKGELLEFMVNDNEYQNDAGRFVITIERIK